MSNPANKAPTHEHAALAGRGGTLALRRWENPANSPLLFVHATGMCASVYKQFLTPLAEDYDITAPDMRGHGRTSLPADPSTLRNWHIYAEDLEQYLLSLPQPKDGWRLMGHSMGAATSLLVAARGKVRVTRLVLIEPVIIPDWTRWIAMSPLQPVLRKMFPIAKQAAQRRATWPDRTTALETYGRKGFFRRWAPGVLEDYLEDGLQTQEDEMRLSCAPAWESATFAAQGQNVWSAFDTVQGSATQVHVFIAEHESTVMAQARDRLAARGINTTFLPDSSHLVPMEKPDRLATLVAKQLA
ncbi:alpha/beta hydrolase [Parvularcula sp. IMCC14364]|uniref:alpha/beta hydrolase n=1 Tax=Parvularcula sp. IMCC14364 TaxID=3067902 RepID=UPI002741D0CD|nr:alpha/beta hydrolase [Parvularcula sp. IMCC14364]